MQDISFLPVRASDRLLIHTMLENSTIGLAHCGKCELKENLWLCLTCGSLGCGRQQYGGTGGNGHGLQHFQETGHNVSVKLGTITSEGNAGTLRSPTTKGCFNVVCDRYLLLYLQRLEAGSRYCVPFV
jgi:hypothetical protein